MRTHDSPGLDRETTKVVSSIMSTIPKGVYLLTTEYENERLGMVIHHVNQACHKPPTVSVSIPKGSVIMAAISESHRFGLAVLSEQCNGLRHRIESMRAKHDGHEQDMFMGMPEIKVPGNVPIPKHCVAWLSCELMMHMDLEGDADLFLGRVIGGGISEGGTPQLYAPEA